MIRDYICRSSKSTIKREIRTSRIGHLKSTAKGTIVRSQEIGDLADSNIQIRIK